jgi:hypothetical protein
VTRLPRPLARLLAAILLVQAVLAPAHALAMAAAPAGLAVVLCSPEGPRILHLGPDGQEMPADQTAQGFCAACAALPQVALPAPPRLPAPGGAATAPAWHAAAPGVPPPPARGPPFASRAPPAFG